MHTAGEKQKEGGVRMRALQIRGRQDVALVDLPPEAMADGMVRVAVDRVGLCGTDFALTAGTLGLNVLPVVPGHEVLGTVVASRSAALRVGKRVILDPLLNCGHCPACGQGHPQWCSAVGVIGVVRDGGAREEMVLPAERWLPWPAELPLDAGVLVEPAQVVATIVQAMGATVPEQMLLVGTGALGLMLVRVLRQQWPATTLWVHDTVPERRDRALALGGRDWHPGVGPALDVVVDGVGASDTLALAAESVRAGGHIVVYGVPKADTLLPSPAGLFRKNVRMTFSRLYTHDFAQAMAWVANGVIRPQEVVSDRLALEEAAEFLRERRWNAPARWGKTLIRVRDGE